MTSFKGETAAWTTLGAVLAGLTVLQTVTAPDVLQRAFSAKPTGPLLTMQRLNGFGFIPLVAIVVALLGAANGDWVNTATRQRLNSALLWFATAAPLAVGAAALADTPHIDINFVGLIGLLAAVIAAVSILSLANISDGKPFATATSSLLTSVPALLQPRNLASACYSLMSVLTIGSGLVAAAVPAWVAGQMFKHPIGPLDYLGVRLFGIGVVVVGLIAAELKGAADRGELGYRPYRTFNAALIVTAATKCAVIANAVFAQRCAWESGLPIINMSILAGAFVLTAVNFITVPAGSAAKDVSQKAQ